MQCSSKTYLKNRMPNNGGAAEINSVELSEFAWESTPRKITLWNRTLKIAGFAEKD